MVNRLTVLSRWKIAVELLNTICDYLRIVKLILNLIELGILGQAKRGEGKEALLN